ncbi:MAG TPA: hypothetical protein VHP63_00415 [candidate division Zixibacteria bacterium]|nr:hypothetical protein [candidate division Zixibacteria bacterium]
MLSEHEKAYCQALLALKQKEYSKALESFEKAAGAYGTNDEFNLLYESTRLLVEVKNELAGAASTIRLEEKELIING